MDRKRLIALIVCLVVLGAGIVFWTFRDNMPDVKSANVATLRSRVVGLVVQRDTSLVQKNVSQENRNAGQLWSLAPPRNSRQEFVIDANYEEGDSLKKLTGYTKQSLRDSVVANANLQLPKQYPGYKEITQRNLMVNGFEASETVFEYVTSDVRVKQRLLLLVKNSQTVVYIRAQARATDFKTINERYFDSIFSSAQFL